ncbi:MAG: hypothetical protein ACR2N3_04060 [Pyrinomonadaceae bacterium]
MMCVFLIEILSGNLLFGFVPESGALMLCGVSLIGGTVVARRFLKQHDKEVGKTKSDLIENGETK